MATAAIGSSRCSKLSCRHLPASSVPLVVSLLCDCCVVCRTRPHLAANSAADDPAARARLPTESPPDKIQLVRCSSSADSAGSNSNSSNSTSTLVGSGDVSSSSSVQGYGSAAVDADVTALLCWSDRQVSALATCTAGKSWGSLSWPAGTLVVEQHYSAQPVLSASYLSQDTCDALIACNHTDNTSLLVALHNNCHCYCLSTTSQVLAGAALSATASQLPP